MKNLAIILSLLLLCSCQQNTITIEGRMTGTDARTVSVEYTDAAQQLIIDSVELDEGGNFALKLHRDCPTPEFFTLRCGNEELPLLLQQGDHLTLNAIGNLVRNYTVEGSPESAKLRKFYRDYTAGMQELDRLSKAYAMTSGSAREEALKSYTETFRRIKRDQLRFIVEHKDSPAAIYALYQRLPGDGYLASAESDVVYFRTVAEALAESCPESPYLKRLEEDIARLEAQQQLLSQVRETNYPDLEMNDMYGKRQRLSSLSGQVILLDFWSAMAGNSNRLNAELKELYATYHEQGLEIYQVGVDLSKARWINAVQEQQLPWISVSDLQGENSIACRLYQVQKLPSNFLFDREGNIVGRDLYGKQLEEAVKKVL